MTSAWMALASCLLCLLVGSALASRPSFPEYEPEGLWADDEDREGPWPEKEMAALSRQIFGQKADASAEVLESVSKRESPSLSIVNPLDVLRQRLMLEMARRRMKENQDQIRENDLFLKKLGRKRRADTRRTRRQQVSSSDGYQV